MKCSNCSREVPEGMFCANCGAHQSRVVGLGVRRPQRFAANPDEEVTQASVFGSLFPHLNHHETNTFRWAFLAGLVTIFALYVAGLITGAILAAAFFLPVLYLIYLYEVRVYRDAPLRVVGLTLGVGLILGLVISLATEWLYRAVPALEPVRADRRMDLLGLAVFAVLIPIVQEALKPLPALVLRKRPEFHPSIDGLVFGIAAGLGFAFAETLVVFSEVIPTLEVPTPGADWIFPLLAAGVLRPLLHGTTTGVIAASLWSGRRRPGDMSRSAWIVAAVLSHIVFQVGSVWLATSRLSLIAVLAFQVLVVICILTAMRWLLHRLLLEEAASFGNALTSCPNCSAAITADAFCPHCGMSLSAARAVLPQPIKAGSREAT